MECHRWWVPHVMWAAMVLIGIVASRGGAEPFWRRIIPVHRVAADPNADYRLQEKNGPWLILAATFSGEGAEAQARELVLELRRRYKLAAYLHEMSFDFSQELRGRGVNRYGKPRHMRYQRNRKILEVAVLVGDYPSFDDPEAQKTLRRIKTFRPDTLDLKHRRKTSQSLAALRTIQAALLSGDETRKKLGPMSRAFISRNPLLPRSYFVQDGPDELVVRMNKGVSHSLFDCQGKYSVQVATFGGTVVIDQHKIQRLQKRKHLPSRLAQAADKAHRLAVALRRKGFDAYEFHDRNASLVTIGSFNSIGTPRADGKIEINPQIYAIMKRFGAAPAQASAGAPPMGFTPKTLSGIPFDIQPKIVHVPRRPTRQVAFHR